MNSDRTYKEVFPVESSLDEFQKAVSDWFDITGEDYPWRQTHDPYAIMVSELMLQQTQIATVLGRGYFSRWMKQFPNWETLAGATEDQILKAWEGLGYYNRARNLQKAAVQVMSRHGGECPADSEQLEELAGVGRYTAGAVASFAFGRQAPIVDGNVARVLARLFHFREPVDSGPGLRALWSWAEKMTPSDRVRSYNSGIMELGQRICTKGTPACAECPVQRWCLGQRAGEPEKLPLKKTKVKTILRDEHVALMVESGRIYLEQESGRRRQGLWRLPELSLEETEDLEEFFRFDYAITRYRVTLKVFRVPEPVWKEMIASRAGKWYHFAKEEELPAMGSPYRKAILKFQNSHEDLIMNE